MRIATGQTDETHKVLEIGIPDPGGEPPLCGEEEFAALVAEVVANDAPRLFAVVAEYGERVDAMCVAWGMAFEKGAYAVSVDGRKQFVVSRPDLVLPHFRVRGSVSARLVWPDSAKSSPPPIED
ncbi:hypothetical protein KIPE111705_40280 [Kibdelosporangium persicum]|uniref:Immunity protein 35 n=1 Tax=Kibdelosporangium persicum TaxID=2698649 RepID=A0ABX2FIZ5_9PSEU|nr:hypothetical protein [Kibdelosporangium persicum]NRN70708.1 hypothetical protein [Kibdelosporangium persicum]